MKQITNKSFISEQVKKAYEKDEITLIDVRDIRELWRGNYQNSIHISRGMLEFWLDLKALIFTKKNRRYEEYSFILCFRI